MTGSIFNKEDIFAVTPKMVDEIKKKAKASPRKRFRLCLHHSVEHQTHEMLIVFHKDTYMPPHRHPKGKSESYHVIEGSMTVFFFDDNGKMIDKIDMGQYGGNKPFLYRLSDSIWHMPVPTSEWLVFHETYSGPFVKDDDVEFPSWAPKEGDNVQIKRFIAAISGIK
ncbi:WbuC family cupin fold metalloprotein [Candidatus Margulisiibacteriota bacterium]